MPDPVPGPAALARLLVDFGRELRLAGIPVGTGDVMAYCAAAAALEPSDLLDLYWAGRTTMLTARGQLPVYDEVFRRFFLGEGSAVPETRVVMRNTVQGQSVLQVPAAEPGTGGRGEEEEARLGLMASDAEVLRGKSFAACTVEELAALRRIMLRIRLVPPRRRTRRTARARSGHRPDLRRTMRESMRLHGEPAELYWRRRGMRMRPVVLILDVSGSMSDYSRSLLQFAYSTKRAATRVEVFCFGTRLTRVTRGSSATGRTTPWTGRRGRSSTGRAARGIGDSLDTFVRRWGSRGLCRGAIVVICSDGLDRGDPAVLARAMERLSRLSHRIVWMNPHKGTDADFRPSTLGMMVAAPHVDVLLSGHDLRSLEEFAALLPSLS